jgi:molecular chaperone DnaK (HSP70)
MYLEMESTRKGSGTSSDGNAGVPSNEGIEKSEAKVRMRQRRSGGGSSSTNVGQWMLSLVAVSVCFCAVLAAMGFRGRVTTIGVDLGTTFSVVGVNMGGKTGVVIVTDKEGHRIFPSIVSYLDNGEIRSCYDALPLLKKDPEKTIYNAKRFIGRSLDDEVVAEYARNHPFHVVMSNESDYSKVGFKVSATGHNMKKSKKDEEASLQKSTIGRLLSKLSPFLPVRVASFLRQHLNAILTSSLTLHFSSTTSSTTSSTSASTDSTATTTSPSSSISHSPPFVVLTPEDIGEQVLRALLKITAIFMGHNQVNKAIIAVPAKFNSEQRSATAAAFKAAGLKVIRVLEEPTAAAVAYRLHKKQNIHHILVYDFGGGTLDVSLLYVSKGSVQVYATDGDEMLGGSDLDVCLFNMITRKVAEQQQQLKCDSTFLRVLAEQIKKDLSAKEQVQFSCPDSSSSSINNDTHETRFHVSRSDFETECSYLFERAMTPVTRLLNELDMSKGEVDEVVLVGGTTRIPKIKQQLRKFFGKDLNDHIDPDVTVAFGCASVLD